MIQQISSIHLLEKGTYIEVMVLKIKAELAANEKQFLSP